jgi:exopolysaccharide biosynthesis polyprenyl glycosylphosphotransferase
MEADIKYICSPRARRLKTLILECEMVFMADDVEAQQKNDIIKFCLDNRRGIIFVPAFSDIFTFNSHFSQIDDMPAFQVKPLKISFTNLLVKRFLDVALCLAALVVCILPMLMIAICMKAGGGSVFYRQKRVTKGGRVFNMIKFRTMVENAESMSGPVTSTGNDPRITRLGHFLRATRFDELPQIINILKGDMTIVGPRPERPFFVEKYAAEIPEYNLRHTVKAGLTGFAQVQGKYSTTIRDKLKYDLMYINGYKLADDIKLMMQTANILLKKESAEGWQEYAEVERAIEKIEKVTD